MEEHNDLISVIVPVYKVEKYLPRCVDSIINQTYKNLEIILVDDGSPDNCGKICDEYAKKDSRIKVIHKENGGQASARNMALDIAKGEYIGFVDSDDYIKDDMYEELYFRLKNSKSDIACCGRFNVFEDNTENEQFTLSEPLVMDGETAIRRTLMWDAMDSSPCDKLYKRSIFESIRYPAGKINEDTAIAFKLIEKADKIIHIGKPKYYYFHHKNSTTTNRFSAKNLDLFYISDKIYEELMPKYPYMAKSIKYFYLHNIGYLYLKIINEDMEQGFYTDLKKMQSILKKNTINIILNKFSVKNKLKIIIALYSPGGYKKIIRIKERFS